MRAFIFGSLALGLAACGGAEIAEPVDPYADLGDQLLVRFEANPEIEAGQCNPKVHYALKSDMEALRLNVNLVINDSDLLGSGFSLIPRDVPGVITADETLSLFDPVAQACSDITVTVQELTCREGESEETSACPPFKFEGTDMFAAFTEPLR